MTTPTDEAVQAAEPLKDVVARLRKTGRDTRLVSSVPHILPDDLSRLLDAAEAHLASVVPPNPCAPCCGGDLRCADCGDHHHPVEDCDKEKAMAEYTTCKRCGHSRDGDGLKEWLRGAVAMGHAMGRKPKALCGVPDEDIDSVVATWLAAPQEAIAALTAERDELRRALEAVTKDDSRCLGYGDPCGKCGRCTAHAALAKGQES